jgi:hypothetical protein
MKAQISPIFILGVHRSGTTLIRFILSSHSDIYIPPESDFIPRFFLNKPFKALTARDVKQLLHTIFTRYRFVEDWQGPQPNFKNFLDEETGTTTPSNFLSKLYGRYAVQNMASRWGDKTPIYTSYVKLIHQLFPQTQFIHILRDPRDAAISLLERYAHREIHVDTYFAAKNWVRRITKARADAASLPVGQYLEIRYEELVSTPEAVVRNMCNFLNESFQPSMIQQELLARTKIEPDDYFFNNVRNPLHNQSIGRWMNNLTDQDVRLIQAVTGPLMVELGYPLVDIGPMSKSEVVRMQRLSTKYQVLQSGRRVFQQLGLMPPI